MRKVPLQNSKEKALVDDEDYERVMKYNWYIKDTPERAEKITVMRVEEPQLPLANFIMEKIFKKHERN